MKRFLAIPLFLAVILVLNVMPLSAAEIWRLGVDDNSNLEFLDVRDYNNYVKKVPGEPNFVIGQNHPKSDWPSVHPGPADTWAGSKSHTFTIAFDMPEINPDVVYELVLDGTAHYGQPPVFEIDLNGAKQMLETHANCTSDQAIAAGKGESFPYKAAFLSVVLKAKDNRLTITSKRGSWFLYDCIGLYSRTGKIDGLNVTPMRGVMNSGAYPNIPAGSFLRNVKVDYQGEVLVKPARAVISVGNLTTARRLFPTESAYGFEAQIPVATFDQELSGKIELSVEGEVIAASDFVIPPERPWEVHLIHQTHLDVGYTHTQQEVLERQVQALKDALKYIDASKDFPPEAKFKWHPEGMWAIDEFFRTATEEEKAKFIAAAQARDIHLDALYSQAMTGLFNEEELYELMSNAVRFGKEHGVVIDSAMQTDVPGYTWGFVTAMAQNGIKYLNLGPNHVHRVGRLFYWGDKPFWWVSPSGKERVLVWMLGTGYYQWHGKPRDHQLQESEIFRLIDRYEGLGEAYPYDLLMVRFGLEGDNGRPNPNISGAVKAWNEKYVYPRLILSRNSDAMAEMEKRYGDALPVVAGDYTGHWEDGAASTSEATAINRASHEKILQAQTLWTLLKPQAFPFAGFDAAWIDILMYDEHTWGAYNSISKPDDDFAVQQDAYKQEYARRGARLVDDLLQKALADRIDENSNVIEVFNTSSWPRDNWVMLKTDAKWNSAVDKDGKGVPCQKLYDGTLAFQASVPAFGSACFTLLETANQALAPTVKAEEVPAGFPDISAYSTSATKSIIKEMMTLVPGGIGDLLVSNANAEDIHIVNKGDDGNRGLNDMLYIIGRNANENRDRAIKDLQIQAVDNGPYILSRTYESTAPNCEKLTQICRYFLTDGYIEFTNIIDKKPERRPEAMFFGFPFALENGKWRYDVPWAMPEVEKDQLPGANRNYYTIQRFYNYGNDTANIDWLSLDAPMVQFAPVMLQPNAYNMDTDWREHIEPNGTIYSWVCNNHWETNYKADQSGRLVFRYVIRPNAGAFNQTDSQKFAREIFQPLIAVPVKKDTNPLSTPGGINVLDNSSVIVTSIKPARGDRAMIARLFNTSDQPATVAGLGQIRAKLSIANTVDDPLEPVGDSLDFASHEVKTIRIE
ncbi:MAG: polysaccharide lyase family protein [Planctomycetaceae bacterium]|nr:polysaccharide lyase family protein [Planctomycetaceae bacterium]